MRPIVKGQVAWCVGLSVTVVSPAKTAELIQMPFGCGLGCAEGIRWNVRCYGVRWNVDWLNLANTTEPSMCGADAAFVKLL